MNTLNKETYSLVPTGDGEIDTKQFISLMKAIPDKGAKVTVIDNAQPLILDERVTREIVINKPITLVGETENVEIRKTRRLNLRIGSWQNPLLVNPITEDKPFANRIGVYSFEGLSKGTSIFKDPGIGLKTGDWVCIFSEDPVSGTGAHIRGGKTKPMQLSKVCYVKDGSVVLSSPAQQEMTTVARIQKMNTIRGISLENLRLGTQPIPGEEIEVRRVVGIILNNVENVNLTNINIDETGFGSLIVERGINVNFLGTNCLSQPVPDIDYGVAIACVHGFRFQHSTWYECRHVFTTTGIQKGADRWFGTTDTKVHRVVAYSGGDPEGNSFAVFDTHAEGDGIEFSSCEVYAAGKDQVVGYSMRAPGNRFNQCKFHAGNSNSNPPNIHVGWRLMAERNVLKGCEINNAWMGIRIGGLVEGSNSQVIEDCDFNDCSTVGIIVADSGNCDNIEILNNRFRRTGWYDNAGTPRIRETIIQIESGTGHKIRGNDLDQKSNGSRYSLSLGQLKASDVDISANYCRGYGKGKLGIQGDFGDPRGVTPTGPEIQNAWVSQNYVDR